MTRTVRGLAVVAVAVSCARRPHAFPYQWQLYGQIVSASATEFELRHKTGHRVVVHIDDHTVFVKHQQTVSWRELSRGSRVTVDVETISGGENVARHVQISGG